MFHSFFPRPRALFPFVLIWAGLAMTLWFLGGSGWGAAIGLPPLAPGQSLPTDATRFWAPSMLWFYLYYWLWAGGFMAIWFRVAPHRWQLWSLGGSALIIFVTAFLVEINVAINAWYGPFWDLIQKALAPHSQITAAELYKGMLDFAGMAFIAVTVNVMNMFFVSHYIFRWRTAMNDYYMHHWRRLREVEGAAQRVQEDTMRFASTMESLGVNLLKAVLTLIAFLPVLAALSKHVPVLPVVGAIPYSLVVAAIVWSFMGTVFLGLVGIRLPGLEFRNQRVEAAYRKELVYGEDNLERAAPPTVVQLFNGVRRNYFRLYFHYVYFNVARTFYLQADVVFGFIVLTPSIIAGMLTLGLLQQVLNVFGQVRDSFQYLVNAWPTIVELLSIRKRLRAFESVIGGRPPSSPLEAEVELELIP